MLNRINSPQEGKEGRPKHNDGSEDDTGQKLNIWEEEKDVHRKFFKKHIKVNQIVNRRDILLKQRQVTSSLHWEIAPNEVTIISRFARGSFSTVYKGKWCSALIAVKVVDFDIEDPNIYESFLDEVSLLSMLNHPNILRFFGACLHPPNTFIVTEFATKGSLFKLLENDRQNKFLTLQERVSIAVHASRGLHYLHSQRPPILHRDIKSLNFLVTDNYLIKIADFGISKNKSETLNTKLGTLNWLPPELLKDNTPFTEASDVYSFGVVLWEIFTSEIPYESIDNFRVIRMISMGELLKIPKQLPIHVQQILIGSWDMTPEKRVSMELISKTLEQLESEITRK